MGQEPMKRAIPDFGITCTILSVASLWKAFQQLILKDSYGDNP